MIRSPVFPVFPVLPVLPELPPKRLPKPPSPEPPKPLSPEPVLELPAGLTSTPRKAVVPMCTVDEAFPATIWRAMVSAVLIGMAKPCVPDDWSLDWNEKPAEAAVSMPST